MRKTERAAATAEKAATAHGPEAICPACGRPFGYVIDGVFHAVAWHGHRTAAGAATICKPEARR